VATALLDRLLRHAIVIKIEGSSYRLRQHAERRDEERSEIVHDASGASGPRAYALEGLSR